MQRVTDKRIQVFVVGFLFFFIYLSNSLLSELCYIMTSSGISSKNGHDTITHVP